MFVKSLKAGALFLGLAAGSIALSGSAATAWGGGGYDGSGIYGPWVQGYHKHRHWGGWGYQPYPRCEWREVRVWTPYGPRWISKRICR